MTLVLCKQCKKSFNAKPSWIKNGYGIYCSAQCQHEGARMGEFKRCFICGTETYKQRKAIRKSKSKKFFCSKSCQTRWRNTEYTEEKHANWKGGTHAYRRIMYQSGKEPICQLCKVMDERILAVHHIDENRKNNSIENPAWLCHNCHHLIHCFADEREKFMATIV